MFKKDNYQLSEVFGQTRGIPLNYVERDDVDNIFKEALKASQHIVIHGSSKQGKTSLRKIHLEKDDFILVHCSNKWDIGKLNAQILKQVGFELKGSRETTIEGNLKMTAKVKIFSAELGGEGGGGVNEKQTYRSLELDVYDVNDIIDSLESIHFNKFILLEDFHYLDEQTQRDFAFQLKAFHEMSNLTFVIIGVWLEENKLTLLNGDLAGRIFSINADVWRKDELKSVISSGEKLLNIHFTHQLKTLIIDHSLGSVFLLQEICKSICQQLSIIETQKDKKKILENEIDVFSIARTVVLQQRGRYESFLRVFFNGLDDENRELYRWILLPIIEAETEERIKGISFENTSEIISKNTSSKIEYNQLLNMLNKLSELQRLANVKPKILDFDNTNFCINIVDRGFISWLIFQNKDHLKDKLLIT